MEEKIREIQNWRDELANQFEKDTKGMTSIDRLDNIRINGIIKGLDIALCILKDKPNITIKFIDDCIYHDCAQGRHKCTNIKIKSNRCQGICNEFTPKLNEKDISYDTN